MNRRDTILIAVLINMGILVTLFITALKPSSTADLAMENLGKSPKEVVQKLSSKQERQSIDQIDSILGQYMESPKTKTSEGEVLEIPKVKEEAPKNELILVEKEDKALKEVIVRSGDVLEKIARQNGCLVEEIMRLNHLTDTKLQIGQILYVPTTPSQVAQKVEEPKKNVQEAKYYTVKNGDSPWTIAIKNNIKLEELLRLNNLDEAKAKKLKPGDQLRIK